MKSKTDFEASVREAVDVYGGFYNAHSHGDRAYTFCDRYYPTVQHSVSLFGALTLPEKQNLVWKLHRGPAFKPSCYQERMNRLLEESVSFGVKKLNSCIDVTYNTGLVGWDIANDLKDEFSSTIDFRLGAYNISGFKDGYDFKKRWDYFEGAAEEADFLVALAEKDRKKGHIGEEQHNVYFLNKGLELGVPVHFHVGQENRASDKGVEVLFNNMHQVFDLQHRLSEDEYPRNYLVHDISAACFEEDEFKKHVESLKRYNVGVVCCPTAGLSMKQDRNINAPTHNSLARVWDYVLNDVPVYVGTDNINDVFVPSSSPDLYDELAVLSHALRLYNPEIIAKLGSGVNLDDFDRENVRKVVCS